MGIQEDDILVLNKILKFSVNSKEPLSVDNVAKEFKISREESHRLLYLIWEYHNTSGKIGKPYKYDSDDVHFEADIFTQKFIEHGGFGQLLDLTELTENEKIHKILEYMISDESQDSFDTLTISRELNLKLGETNQLVREIIQNDDGKDCTTKDESANKATGILKITATNDAFETEKYLNEIEMAYNIHIRSGSGTFNILNLPEDKLNIITNAYTFGKHHFTISGKKYWIKDLQELKIYTANPDVDMKKFTAYASKNGMISNSLRGFYYLPKALDLIGRDITGEILGDMEYGEELIDLTVTKQTGDYVNGMRMMELRSINNEKFDLSWLIRLCEELNYNFSAGNYLSVAMLSRTILNHVPPIFGKTNFEEIVNNYGAPKEHKSFKSNMNRLFESLKNIADRILHGQIRDKESLPNETQIDFRQDFDVLLGEIVRILK